MAVKPVVHGKDHMVGGADPIPGLGGGGIQFNVTPQSGTFFDLRTTGTTGTGGPGINLEANQLFNITSNSLDVSIWAGRYANMFGTSDVAIGSDSGVGITAPTINIGGGMVVVDQSGATATIALVGDAVSLTSNVGDFRLTLLAGFWVYGLPTSAPAGAHYLWNDGGTVKIT